MHTLPLITVIFCFAVLGLLVWYALSRRLAAERARQELQLRLLQSAGSPAELRELIRSDEARILFAGVPTAAADLPPTDSRRYAIRAVKTGVVLIFLGVGMLALMVFSNRDWVVGAALALTGGLGLLASALISVWLSRRFEKRI